MLNSASMDYGYENDDMLTDAISLLSMIACAMGEIRMYKMTLLVIQRVQTMRRFQISLN